jgi:hypothetical protein
VSELPRELKVALEQHRKSDLAAPPVDIHSARVSRGDLRLVRPFDGADIDARLALVLSVDRERGFAEMMLVHSAPELACEMDAHIDSRMGFTSYPVVIETDLRGVVWITQLGRAAGRVGEEVLGALAAVAARQVSPEQTDATVVVTGTRLAGPADPRWSFKRAEGIALRELARDCTEAVLDEGTPWVVDPGVLQPELLELAADPVAVVTDLMHWIETRPVEVSDTDVHQLLELGVFESNAWTSAGDMAADVVTALHLLIEHAATSGATSRRSGPAFWRVLTALHLDRTWTDEPETVHFLGERERVAA